MGPHALATLRTALRAPSTYALAALGGLAVVAGLGLSILALRGASVSQDVLVVETAGTMSALAALWLLVRLLDSDRYSGFTQAIDQTRSGAGGRILGRLLGVTMAALLVALPSAIIGWMLIESSVLYDLYLYCTIITQTLLLGAWGVFFFSLGVPSQAVLVSGALLWMAGHLPWGSPGWGPEGWGPAAAALLPGGAGGSGLLLARALAAVGLVLLALALARPSSHSA